MLFSTLLFASIVNVFTESYVVDVTKQPAVQSIVTISVAAGAALNIWGL